MTQQYNPSVNTQRYNITVVGTGLSNYGNTVEVLGTAPPAKFMPVFIAGYPHLPTFVINEIDSIYGTLVLQPSGTADTQDQGYFKNYPQDVNVWAADATKFVAWPTGLGCYQRGHTTLTAGTGVGPVRGLDNNGTPTFLHG